MLFGLLRSNRPERAGFALYGAAVAAARDPFFYATLGVPDTLDGRFDLIGLHVFLVIRRLQTLGDQGVLAQAVFDAMFSDMDQNLREMGVGDLSVGKRVRVMWEAFHGRSHAYERALAAGDGALLAEALRRNVWRGVEAATGEADGAARLARLVLAEDAHLRQQVASALQRGEVDFLPPGSVAP